MLGSAALQEAIKKLDDQLLESHRSIRALDLEIREATTGIKNAKQMAADMRKEIQLIPLPLMQIDGIDANGGGMSRPGTGDYEVLGSHCG